MDIFVVIMFLIAAAIMIGLPLLIGRWANQKYKVSWKIFGWGALGFLLVQLVHTPLTLLMQSGVFAYFQSLTGNELIVYSLLGVVFGLLAGLFEEIGRYVFFKWKQKEWKLDLHKALMFGAGWGGIESIILGVLLLTSAIGYVTAAPLTPEYIQSINASMNGTMTAADVTTINNQMDAFMKLTPIDLLPAPIERTGTILFHITMTLMVAVAVIENRKIMLVGAIFFHSLLDFSIVPVTKLWDIWPAEAIVVAAGIASLWYIRKKLR